MAKTSLDVTLLLAPFVDKLKQLSGNRIVPARGNHPIAMLKQAKLDKKGNTVDLHHDRYHSKVSFPSLAQEKPSKSVDARIIITVAEIEAAAHPLVTTPIAENVDYAMPPGATRVGKEVHHPASQASMVWNDTLTNSDEAHGAGRGKCDGMRLLTTLDFEFLGDMNSTMALPMVVAAMRFVRDMMAASGSDEQ